MDNKKNDEYYIERMIKDVDFLLTHTKGLSLIDIEQNEVLLDSIMFRLVQISESSDKLSSEYKEKNLELPWRAIKGMRNRIVHAYGDVDLTVVYETVTNDIPTLKYLLEKAHNA